ncbi:MAG TPA: molybdate ABC transporter substrate-binding protein [Methylocella sp.]|nr:molybdate ABC transporter substrate-binding protein [Methylocella sp.]
MTTATRRGIARFMFIFIIAAVTLFARPSTAQQPEASGKGPVVFAAASLKTALDEIAAAFAAETGKTAPVVYASSAILAKQIEQGAPADIFISADIDWMDYLARSGLIRSETRRNLLGNALVLIEPSNANTDLVIASGFDLAGATGNGKIAVCTIASCPGGIYAKQALDALGIWAKVEPKLAQADNIRSALNLVSRGEASFGIVYATDAKADPKVKVVGVFPESTHSPIIYPAALVGTSKNSDAARFLDFLSSPAADKIWMEQGFTILPK